MLCDANVARFLGLEECFSEPLGRMLWKRTLRASWASRKRAHSLRTAFFPTVQGAHIRTAFFPTVQGSLFLFFVCLRRECCALPPPPDRRLMSPLGTWVCATGRRRRRCAGVCTRAPWRASRKRRALAWVRLPKASRSGARSRARQQYIYV
jgi:hypothetical protein